MPLQSTWFTLINLTVPVNWAIKTVLVCAYESFPLICDGIHLENCHSSVCFYFCARGNGGRSLQCHTWSVLSSVFKWTATPTALCRNIQPCSPLSYKGIVYSRHFLSWLWVLLSRFAFCSHKYHFCQSVISASCSHNLIFPLLLWQVILQYYFSLHVARAFCLPPCILVLCSQHLSFFSFMNICGQILSLCTFGRSDSVPGYSGTLTKMFFFTPHACLACWSVIIMTYACPFSPLAVLRSLILHCMSPLYIHKTSG